MPMTVQEAFGKNPYPGRGLLLGLTPNKKHAVLAYFIMGRSESSRNRIFIRDNEDIYTKAREEDKCVHPELLLYAPVRTQKNTVVVGNGDQTDTVFAALSEGGDFETALLSRTFEPDAPNYTPRITGLLYPYEKHCELSVLSCPDGDGVACERRTYRLPLTPGNAYALHTYWQGDPTQPFRGEPLTLATMDEMALFTGLLWDALDSDNRISLYVRYISIRDKTYTDSLINRY